MKSFFLLLACLMIVRSLRLLHAGKTYRRRYLVFWIGFAGLVMAQNSPLNVGLCGLLLLILVWKPFSLFLAIVGFLVSCFVGRGIHSVGRGIRSFLLHCAVWLACLLGRAVLVVYGNHRQLTSLVETQVFPRLGPRTIVIRNGFVERRHRFHSLDRLASQSMAGFTSAAALVRLRPFAAPLHYDLRKALWMRKNGLPAELERILAAVLHPNA